MRKSNLKIETNLSDYEKRKASSPESRNKFKEHGDVGYIASLTNNDGQFSSGSRQNDHDQANNPKTLVVDQAAALRAGNNLSEGATDSIEEPNQ